MGVGAILGTILGVMLLLIMLAFVWWFVAVYQAIITKRNNAEDAFGELNGLLKARYEDISQFAEAIGENCDDEIKTQLLKARNLAMASATVKEQLENEAKLEMQIERALLVYQEEKQNMSQEQQKICDNLYKNQEFINKSRKFYNSIVKAYNDELATVPGKFWSQMRNLQPMTIFNLQID